MRSYYDKYHLGIISLAEKIISLTRSFLFFFLLLDIAIVNFK